MTSLEIGDVVGHLTIIAVPRKGRRVCKCVCGATVTLLASMLRGSRRSCGCRKYDEVSRRMSAINTTHGQSGSRTFRSWSAMKSRCSNPNTKRFYDYGGRGIRVCERWNRFENFLADMGERPEGKTIDRYPDKNGNYEPGNCRWATPKEQIANQRPKSSRVLSGRAPSDVMWLANLGFRHSVIAPVFGASQSTITSVVNGHMLAKFSRLVPTRDEVIFRCAFLTVLIESGRMDLPPAVEEHW